MGDLRKFAANTVRAGTRVLHNAVVVVEGGIVTDWYELTQEQPSTEWIGGTIIIGNDAGGRLRAYKDGVMLG